MQEDPTGQKYGRLEEEGGMGPDKVDSQLIFKTNHPTVLKNTLDSATNFRLLSICLLGVIVIVSKKVGAA